jgi:hypothetical protein
VLAMMCARDKNKPYDNDLFHSRSLFIESVELANVGECLAVRQRLIGE